MLLHKAINLEGQVSVYPDANYPDSMVNIVLNCDFATGFDQFRYPVKNVKVVWSPHDGFNHCLPYLIYIHFNSGSIPK
jgi:hypothetical protein